MAKIKIFNGNITTRELELSDCGHTWENKGRSIKWKIADPEKSNVDSFDIVVKSGAEIFSDLPGKNKNGKWRAKIDKDARGNAECEYSIFWKAKGETETFEHDPKISVNPSFSILPMIIGLVSFVSVAFLFSKITRR